MQKSARHESMKSERIFSGSFSFGWSRCDEVEFLSLWFFLEFSFHGVRRQKPANRRRQPTKRLMFRVEKTETKTVEFFALSRSECKLYSISNFETLARCCSSSWLSLFCWRSATVICNHQVSRNIYAILSVRLHSTLNRLLQPSTHLWVVFDEDDFSDSSCLLFNLKLG